MTFEKFEEAKEVYEEYEKMSSLAIFFNKGQFTDGRDMTIVEKRKNGGETNSVFIPDEIREKINDLLWDEVHKIREKFDLI